MKRRIFINDEHHQQFERDGYVRLNRLPETDVAELRRLFADGSTPISGFHHSLELESPEQKRRIHQHLAAVYDSHWRRHFDRYLAMACTFVSKSGEDAHSIVRPHQDWSFVREDQYTSLNLWSPLCDTNDENGALGLVVGSHTWPWHVRGTNIRPTHPMPEPLPLRFFHLQAGEVLAYDHRLVHASGPNRTSAIRTAISINIIPSEAVPVHYVGDKKNPGTMTELEVDDQFFYNYRMNTEAYRHPTTNHDVRSTGYRARTMRTSESGMAAVVRRLKRLFG